MAHLPKLVVIISVFVGFSAVFSAFPSYSSGSMAPESRVIIVEPAPEIRRQSQIRQMKKARQAADKAEARSEKSAEKARQKSRDAATKAYKKKLADQRKKVKK